MDVVLDNLDEYVAGLRTTVALTVASYAVAFALGVFVAGCRVSPVTPLRAAGATYVEIIRNTPLTALFVLFFFGLTKVGLQWSAFTTAVIVLGLYTGTFVAETVRSGINAVARGQGEAARALGLTFPQVLWTVVLPQALRTVVGPLGSLFIALTKNSGIASIIFVQELTERADQIANDTAQPLAALLGAAAAYLLLTIPSGLAVGVIERRLAVRR